MAVNNNFFLIGIAVSGIEKKGTLENSLYELKIEVDGYKGSTSEHKIVFFGANKVINMLYNSNKQVEGKMIAVKGHLGNIRSSNNYTYSNLLGDEIILLENYKNNTAEKNVSHLDDDLPF